MAAEAELQNRLDSLETSPPPTLRTCWGWWRSLADQCADAVRIAEEKPLPQRARLGSGCGAGDGRRRPSAATWWATLTAESSRRPVWVNREYGVPGFRGRGDLGDRLRATPATPKRSCPPIKRPKSGERSWWPSRRRREAGRAGQIRRRAVGAIPSGLPSEGRNRVRFLHPLRGVEAVGRRGRSDGAGRVDVVETIELLRAMAGRLGRETRR